MADLNFIEDNAGLAAKECDDSAQKESLNEEEGEEEMEDSSPEEEEETLQKARQAITCRSVTLTTLMDDGIIQAGEGVLSIDYLGQRFEADLLANGKIKWPQGSQEEFNTPSAWALHCKRLVNPIKRSGCGWASVKYNNRKLDIWKSIWARKHRTANPLKIKSPHHQPSTSSSTHNLVAAATTPPQPDMASPAPPSSTPLDLQCVPSANKLVADKTLIKPGDVLALKNEDKMVAKEKQGKKHTISESPSKLYPLPRNLARPVGSHQEIPLNLTFDTPVIGKKELISPVARTKAKFGRQEDFCVSRDRKIVSYADLGTRGLDVDPHTLVKCEHFDSQGKIQPFTVSLTSNTLLLMDFHCHLTKSEVVGYLGGRWDSHRQHLSVEQVFPARCRLGDKDRALSVEEEIRRNMKIKNLMVVGWYHSHPYCPPDPSIRDIDCQMSYQLKMRGSGSMYLPCIGFILSPFEKLPPKPDSKIQAYWVMPNLEHPASFNIPMHVTYTVKRDSSLTEDLLSDMKNLTEFYSGALDKIHLKEHWGEAITYLDKVKASLRSKLPEDQLESGTFLDYVQQLLKDMR
ncbi:MPN domain-containing protein-like [Biomphalaria glabrata]|uniref:MPN domain-containing protein-like n=1 Tax=Biomphalaria glabrata TaxID=6526 RepID=A0A9W2Z4I9_BIOGL|nr:MPN domain-containing protein-like [Biomphalaria glabrata]XP_055869887.1 MPN domain-containing protein-like [Biomphalaria glabrata]